MESPEAKEQEPSPFYVVIGGDKDEALKDFDHGEYSSGVVIEQRPDFNRKHFEALKKSHAIPQKHEDIMRTARNAYETVGVVKSVVDLMVEIAIDGFRFVHEDEAVQSIYEAWSDKINLPQSIEQFANYFCVEGNVAVRRKMGTFNLKRKKSKMQIGHVFYDPAAIDLIGGEIALFAGKKNYGLVVNSKFLSRLINDRTYGEDLISQLPAELKTFLNDRNNLKKIRNAAGGGIIIPIESDKLYVAYNKKRDCDIWSKGPLYSILNDILYLEKLRLAKIAALDGWKNNVRIWKLGDHTHEILPSTGAFGKLASILKNNTSGTVDIIWDSMIDMKEFYPPVEKLGDFNENYESVLIGLGVPRSLVGGSAESGGINGMYIGLKNLLKRVAGVRRAILDWINTEIEIFKENTGVIHSPKIVFAVNNLFDEQAYIKLLMDMYDRNMISDRSVLEKFGEHFNIERIRTKEENDERNGGGMAPKAGPFYQPIIPKQNQDYNKDVKILEDELKDSSPQDTNNNKNPTPPDGRPGRPPGSKDSNKRVRRFRSRSEHILLANNIIARLDELLDKPYLNSCNVANKRQLTSDQKEKLDLTKMQLLASMNSDKFDVDGLNIDPQRVAVFTEIYKDYVTNFGKSYDKHVLASVYADMIEYLEN